MVPRGWKGSTLLFSTFCAIVSAVNLGVLIWAAAKSKNSVSEDDGTLVLREGRGSHQCSSIQDLNKWAHLLINLLSTILLSGSNYCMQSLSAPTRSDINSAHSSGRWLDIGVLSIRNLRWISRKRLLLWLLLGLSSLPLHLFYNSAVFISTSSNNYAVFTVDRTFLESNSTNGVDYVDVSYILRSGIQPAGVENMPAISIPELASQLHGDANSKKLVNLTTEECRTAYIKTFQSAYRNVLLVSDSNVGIDVVDNGSSNVVSFLNAEFVSNFKCGGTQAFAWACWPEDSCDLPCDDPKILKQTMSNSTWAPLGPPVQYCLAEPSQEQCSLRFSMDIAILVVVLNFVKLVMMALTALTAFGSNDPPLLTMGDAVASFLENPDPASKGMCLLSASKIKKMCRSLLYQPASQSTALYSGNVRHRWSKAVSLRRWLICLFLYIASLSVAAGFLGRGVTAIVGSKSLSSLWSIGLGNGSGRTLIQNDAMLRSGRSALITSVVLANIPQLVLSLLYFTYNGLFTCMLLASEWKSYSLRRKGLRISSARPKGAERSGYFLQLPFRFSIPLAMASLLFHWLVSQSIFVVNISMLDYTGSPTASLPGTVGHLVTCGYSPIAIIFTISLGVLLIVVLLGFGFGASFHTGMPIAGSCSLAIAAACHSGESAAQGDDGDEMSTSTPTSTGAPTSQQPLMWGEIPGCFRDDDMMTSTQASLRPEKCESTPLVKATGDSADSESESESNLNASLLRKTPTCLTVTESGATDIPGQSLVSRRRPNTTRMALMGNGNGNDNDNDNDEAEETDGIDGYLLRSESLDPHRPRPCRDDDGDVTPSVKQTEMCISDTMGKADHANINNNTIHIPISRPESVPLSSNEKVGHCGFSAGPVTTPVEGRVYA
ncbi:uncharacterized protein A1O5_06395 [Cladophialophora psammophila CBS 110553]|uniref:DUF6536 domain-containing protein n=1 Tax=Cladophialophora psammophila CBS 110553 TaxID=1182543 RepID=W9WQ89_9EURO|nr:uncharacterized protein A1O5_06395 [Cladophialophora psammophila CBS 110553]EXJ70327.1 hypothetical protein A1O5_06395 [Cladophialophora psammophila CBS 110553]